MRDNGLWLRNYEKGDCPQLAQLFYNTVHTVNAKDYTQEQLDAWADGKADLALWEEQFLMHETLVAVWNGIIVGFGDMDVHKSYLDRLYVHRDYQGLGIAGAICDALEKKSPEGHVITHASITAKPFFMKRGYRVLKEQQVERKGRKLTNYVMEK